ncbi:MAG: type II toxin-antitoxin system prevent-host-death family antitoxin [Gammaproteobacteria bacterium]
MSDQPMIFNIAEAKAQLSRLIDRVYHGEKIVIAKNNLPVADLVPHKPQGKRKLGLLKGQLDVPDDLLEADADIEEMFYGRDD